MVKKKSEVVLLEEAEREGREEETEAKGNKERKKRGQRREV